MSSSSSAGYRPAPSASPVTYDLPQLLQEVLDRPVLGEDAPHVHAYLVLRVEENDVAPLQNDRGPADPSFGVGAARANLSSEHFVKDLDLPDVAFEKRVPVRGGAEDDAP